MSIHSSLSGGNRLVRHRNVLTRGERLTRLEDEGRWAEGDAVTHLPKVRSIKVVLKKKKKAKEEEDAAAEGDVAAEGDAAKAPEGDAAAGS